MKALLIVTALCLAAIAVPTFGRRVFHKAERRVARVANGRWILIGIVLSVLIFDGVLTLFFRLPQPRIHDEFSYLLQADTFAHGRVANPTHPLWRYFETFHVLQQPAYVSKYQPGQGLFQAVGQMLWQPILGIWIATALALAALFWMLRGLFTPKWALIGTVLAGLNTQILWWNWSFWGGSVALLGGALVLGGMFRNFKTADTRASVVMGLGCGLLAITRPFEGLLLCLPATILCIVALKRKSGANILSAFILPLLCTCLPFATFTAYYNFRVTRSPFVLPYQVYEKQYSPSPVFIWQHDSPVRSKHRPEIEAYYRREKTNADEQRTLRGYVVALVDKLKSYDRFFLHGILLALVIPAAIRWQKIPARLCLGLFAFVLLVSCGVTFWAFPHYCAMAFPLFFAVEIYGLKYLHAQRRTVLLSRIAVVSICAISVALFAKRLRADQNTQWQYNRADLVSQLNHHKEKQLVLVRYSPGHNRHYEWIYNRADIDHAHVVFAPDGDAEYLKPLLNYFKGYDITHIEPDRPMWGD
jgi:hypothetical protein